MVQDLLAAGHKVTVLDNVMFKRSSLNHVCNHPEFSVVKGVIRMEQTVAPFLKKADIIIPLAALVGAPLCNLDPIGATTIDITVIGGKLFLFILDSLHGFTTVTTITDALSNSLRKLNYSSLDASLEFPTKIQQ